MGSNTFVPVYVSDALKFKRVRDILDERGAWNEEVIKGCFSLLDSQDIL